MDLTKDGIVFVWVPGHMGIKGNSADAELKMPLLATPRLSSSHSQT